jgi:hypothetical protein
MLTETDYIFQPLHLPPFLDSECLSNRNAMLPGALYCSRKLKNPLIEPFALKANKKPIELDTQGVNKVIRVGRSVARIGN